jgi:hypothetical protein
MMSYTRHLLDIFGEGQLGSKSLVRKLLVTLKVVGVFWELSV